MAKSKYRAAGAVVLRGSGDDREVLVVHRPKLEDWSLPKGTIEDGESAPVTAVREVHEETGYRVQLRTKLDPTRYRVNGRTKVVNWWQAQLEPGQLEPDSHDDETDHVQWWSLSRALARLSYATDIGVLAQAVRVPPSVGLLVVRHAKAVSRRNFKGDDDTLRPLSGRGKRQSQELAKLLAAFGVGQLASSSSTRCLDTLAPYAGQAGLEVSAFSELSEENAACDPRGVEWAMSQIRAMALATQTPTAVCGHRPVLPAMISFLELDVDHTLEPAEVIVAPLNEHGQSGTQTEVPPEL